MTEKPCVDVALVHAPVVNRNGEVIGSAVTNLDLHDIARACKTFGVDTYWLVSPFERQQILSRQIVDHWLTGHGRIANPDRGEALSLIRICAGLDEAIANGRKKWGGSLRVVATCARPRPDTIAYARLRQQIHTGRPVLLVFGTAWGLAPEVFEKVQVTLPPICGAGRYNHLSVRSAAAIVLDRLLGCKDGKPV